MARVNVTTETTAKMPKQLRVGQVAGSSTIDGKRPAIIRVNLDTRGKPRTSGEVVVWVTEGGRPRAVAKRNLATGSAFVDVATDLNLNPQISVTSSVGTPNTTQLEFGPLPPGVTLGRREPMFSGRSDLSRMFRRRG
jgi:hypothetical protein